MMWQLVVGCLLLGGAQAYPSGAPSSACTAMIPSGHPANVASGESPYGITLSSTEYSAGSTITVTLEGGDSMGGFLILARPADNATGDPIGSIEADDSSQSALVKTACGKGLTHTSTFHGQIPQLNKIVLKWTAPSPVAGNIIFYVTFVKVKDMYWSRVPSEAVWDGQSARPTTSAPSQITDPPALDPKVSNSECGSTMGCYSDCEGNTCGFLLTWKKSGNKVDFEMFGELADNQGYLALGLGKAPSMTDVSIIACTADSTRVSKVEQYYAPDRVPPTYLSAGPISGEDNKAAIQTENSPKTMSCRFTYDNDVAKGDTSQWKDVDTELYLFIARGPYATNTLSKHSQTPLISPKAVRLENHENIGGSRINYIIKAHACIMVLAWVFCASVGLILARYYKPMWSNTKACGQKVWFSYHRALMLSAMFLTIIGFILILVYQKGKFITPTELPQKAHPILGLIAIICALLNPLIAAVRCGPEDSKRPIFNWVHWFVGTVAHVFAIASVILGCLFVDVAQLPSWLWFTPIGFAAFHILVMIILEIHTYASEKKSKVGNSQPKPSQPAINKAGPPPGEDESKDEKLEVVAIFLGMLVPNAAVPSWIVYVMMIFCIFHVCVEFILEIHQCCMYDKNRDQQEQYAVANASGKASPPQYSGRGFKCAMLVIYMIVVIAITVVLVLTILLGGSVIRLTA